MPSSAIEKMNVLLDEAKALHRNIMPCSGKSDLKDCFTVMGNRLYFWFNTQDHSTHILTSEL